MKKFFALVLVLVLALVLEVAASAEVHAIVTSIDEFTDISSGHVWFVNDAEDLPVGDIYTLVIFDDEIISYHRCESSGIVKAEKMINDLMQIVRLFHFKGVSYN